MSSKAVPQTYRAIIDKVINSVRPDFEENGIEDAVLQALQESWEAKLAMSRVADFASDPRLGAYQSMLPPIEPKQPSRTLDGQPQQGTSAGSGNGKDTTNGHGDGIDKDIKPDPSSLNASTSASASTSAVVSTSAPTASASTSKPSKQAAAESNSLGSDLDESDEDLLSDDELNGDPDDPSSLYGGAGEGDIIIALWEKVQRVKNKWKITLRDGVISTEGKDYVFSKCQGDFEW